MTLSANETANVVVGGKEYDTFTEPPEALQQERSQVAFPVRELTYYLDGGEDVTKVYEEMMTALERDPAFSNDDFYDLPKDKQREVTLERVAILGQQLAASKTDGEYIKRLSIMSMLDGNTSTRTGVHFGLFLSSIRGSGTAEQYKYWVDKGAAHLRRFYGCFGMTEMGHGSNVAGLETTATFDRETDEFIINTPNIAATKWWIGGAAHSATHTVCFARLFVDGKDHGVKSFVVPMRNVEDHSMKPGVACGDIGKKMGRDGIDNGWIQFTNVRIPRQYMLMRYAKVDRDGKVTEPPLAQLAYGALIGGRVSMAADSYHTAKRFLTIAIRYAAIRRQFSSVPGNPESKILDYPYHQRRLMPRLAYALAMRAGSVELHDFWAKTTAQLSSAGQDKQSLNHAIGDLKELFTLSAGLKAFSTWGTADIIDECRQACGGHGYSGYSGFGQGYNDWVVQCTWEGDNNVLTLSTGRSLIKSGVAVRNGKQVGEAVEYLTRADKLASGKLDGRDITDRQVLVEAWESASARGISRAADSFVYLTEKKGLNSTQAFEELSQQRFEVARVHTRQYIIKSFFNSIDKAVDSIKPVLTDLATLFALWSLENDSALFLRAGYITSEDCDKITDLVDQYNKKVRDQSIGITDAFNLSDFFINSPLGSHDGDAYKHYFNKVLRRNPNRDTKPPYYESKMRPFLFRPEDEKLDLSSLDE